MRILVTGANCFVGTALCERLSESGHSVIEARRVAGPDVHSGGRNRDFSVIGDIGAKPPWDLVLAWMWWFTSRLSSIKWGSRLRLRPIAG